MEQRGLIRLHKVINNYYQIYCPIHNEGNERKPSCGVLLNEQVRTMPNGRSQTYPQGWTHCFSCQYVNTLPGLIEDILKSKQITKGGLDWLKENVEGFSHEVEFQYLLPPELSKQLIQGWATGGYAVEAIQAMTKPPYIYVSEDELATYRGTVPYMYERKLNDDIIEKFDVGVDINWRLTPHSPVTPCITFPVRDIEGRTLFIYRRAIARKLFNMPEGLVKPVYGLYELKRYAPGCKSLIICESILDALVCWVYGKPAVALMSTGNAYQIQQLRELNINQFVLGFDADAAGRRATKKFKRALDAVAIIWSYSIEEGKDLNDLSYEEFQALNMV